MGDRPNVFPNFWFNRSYWFGWPTKILSENTHFFFFCQIIHKHTQKSKHLKTPSKNTKTQKLFIFRMFRVFRWSCMFPMTFLAQWFLLDYAKTQLKHLQTPPWKHRTSNTSHFRIFKGHVIVFRLDCRFRRVWEKLLKTAWTEIRFID